MGQSTTKGWCSTAPASPMQGRRDTATFEKAVEVSSQQNQWDTQSGVAVGGSMTLYCPRGTQSLAIQVDRPSDEYDIELLVTNSEDWRKHQVQGWLSDGNIYSQYTVPASSRETAWERRWNEAGRTVGVTLSEKAGTGTFYLDGQAVWTFSYQPTAMHLYEAPQAPLLGCRLHRGGSVHIVGNPQSW
eukprot:TRINITY_DN114694_c0_g1_i1.p1 TRINITY_DN114694_c0_g1~~TRINITY_DN114694_c0_g1_i1.p1  ORF type:complete len:200 (+),score=4.92 TRINITY_DN114694_c0_g1_i1:41-601(+)